MRGLPPRTGRRAGPVAGAATLAALAVGGAVGVGVASTACERYGERYLDALDRWVAALGRVVEEDLRLDVGGPSGPPTTEARPRGGRRGWCPWSAWLAHLPLGYTL